MAHPKDTGGTGDRQSYSYHLVLGKEGRADKTTKEKKKGKAIYREKTSYIHSQGIPHGTGSNAGRGQEAGRAWAGQAQVRWNRLCSLTASLTLKAPHTHTHRHTPRAFVIHPMGSNTSQNSHPTQLKKPQTTHQNSTAEPCVGLGDNKIAMLQPCFRRTPPPARRGPAHPKNQIFRIYFFFLKLIPTAFGFMETPEQGTHTAAPKEAPHAQVVGWVSFFIKSLLLLSGNSQDQPRR